MAGAIPELLGLTISEGISFALGVAMGPALQPLTREITNKSWSAILDTTEGEAHMPLEPDALAEYVAEVAGAIGYGRDEAAKTGIRQEDFDRLLETKHGAPGIGDLLAMLRRGTIGLDDFHHALRKGHLEGRWDEALAELAHVRLSPAQVALGIVRSLLRDPGFLPVDLDLSGGEVPAYPQSTIDPIAEAAAAGVSRERLRVMTGEIGRPMAPESAASAVFRGIINRADFNRAIAEGDIRPEWAAAIFAAARQIPSVADYVNAHIRGWITEGEMHAGAARHGMTADDADLLYLRTGRPAAPGQMATAVARGIDGPDGRPMDKAQFLKGIRESDIRPEWGEMLWEIRFLYPPLFQITRLVQGGAIDADTARDWAVKDRYPPEVVNALYTYWKTPAAAKADSHLAKAQTQLWTTAHRSYVNGESDDATATEKMGRAGVPVSVRDDVLRLWQEERELVRRQLTPAQLKKAWKNEEVNPLTNAPWTRDEALARLIDMGYSPDDASVFLEL